jgi:hypothetical protein
MNLPAGLPRQAQPLDQQCEAGAVALADAAEIHFDLRRLREVRFALFQHIRGGARVEHAADAKASFADRLEPRVAHDFFSACCCEPAGADGFCTVPLATCCSSR